MTQPRPNILTIALFWTVFGIPIYGALALHWLYRRVHRRFIQDHVR
jgi:hypothetical protein